MPKEYKVSGQSKTAPKDLPEGLTVEEIHVDGVATSLFGTTFRVREYADGLISLDSLTTVWGPLTEHKE